MATSDDDDVSRCHCSPAPSIIDTFGHATGDAVIAHIAGPGRDVGAVAGAAIADITGGNAATGALIGAVMKDMRGQADAGRVRELILEKLG